MAAPGQNASAVKLFRNLQARPGLRVRLAGLLQNPNGIGAAIRIGDDQGLPFNWLNDGVKGYLSARHETTPGNLPQFPHLRMTMPVPECMAARLGGTTGEPSDIPDIIFLIRHLELRSAQAVLNLVGQYYPVNRIPVRTQYLVEGLFEEGKV